MLYKFPDLVNKKTLPKIDPKLEEKYSRFMKTDLFGGDDSIDIAWSSEEQRTFTENTGSMSDATKATVEKGIKYHEGLVNNIVEFINWLKKEGERTI